MATDTMYALEETANGERTYYWFDKQEWNYCFWCHLNLRGTQQASFCSAWCRTIATDKTLLNVMNAIRCKYPQKSYVQLKRIINRYRKDKDRHAAKI